MLKRPALDEIRAHWHANGWPIATLALFRMEGEGGDGTQSGGGESGDGAQGTQGGAPDPAQLQAELDKWKAQARKHEERAKANATAASELEKVRQSQMTEQEKAVAEARNTAKAEARAEVIAELGPRLIAAEIRGAAAGRLADEQLATLIPSLNVAAFLTADGDVDTDKVTKFVNGLVSQNDGGDGQQQHRRTLDLGQGARNGGGNTALNGDPLLRDLKAKVGVR